MQYKQQNIPVKVTVAVAEINIRYVTWQKVAFTINVTSLLASLVDNIRGVDAPLQPKPQNDAKNYEIHGLIKSY